MPTTRDIVVMDVPFIHTVHMRYCGCNASDRALNLEQLMRNGWYPATTTDPGTCATFAALDLFCLLSIVANVNVKDFVTTLEKNMNATATESVPDRYKVFGLVQLPVGIAMAKKGATAEDCWVCPHDGKNIPADCFLYMLILAMDANFRMKSGLRKNAQPDKPLGAGLGYMQDGEPYREHLKDYVAEKDVSTCIVFAALLQKDTRVTTGLRCLGVGGVVCARHEMVRPQGIGDLQKGERYANMDYILLASIVGVAAMYIVISYDIACQWRINLPTLPEEMRINLDKVHVSFGLPVWHTAAHERKCQIQNSLTYMEGVAQTDGEGIERLWSHIIQLAWAYKEMNEGAREDAIEDMIDYLNHEHNISQGTSLPLKLVVAMEERDRQVSGFTEVDAGLSEQTRAKWQKKITTWQADRSKPNPYELDVFCDIRVAPGGTATKNSSRGKRVYLAAWKLGMLQAVYMPATVRELEAEEEARDQDQPAPLAEDIKLHLPSELRGPDREHGCRAGLGEMEAKLRQGQCEDAIDYVRNRLHTKRHLLLFRGPNVAGQKAGLRSNMLVERVGERVDVGAQKYGRVREVLIALRGAEACAGYKVLSDDDIRLDEERENDAQARRRLGNIGSSSRSAKRQGPALSSKEKRVS
ncbi:hypothetical protein C8R43DRAFT_1131140 [Mycena crocata]|nr:hypothetical protein C8R43DRAFT_1131140 [Mycena crocata]